MNKMLDILNKSVEYLKKKHIKDARLKVESIFSEVLKMPRIMLYANFEKELSQFEINKIKEKLTDILKRNKDISSSIEVKDDDSLKSLLVKSVDFLKKNHVNEAKLKAEIIFSSILEIERMMLFTKYNEKISKEKKDKLRKFISSENWENL